MVVAVVSFFLFATGQHPACYWSSSVGHMLLDFIVDRHFFLAPPFGKSLDLRCQVKYIRRLPKYFLVLGTLPVKRNEKR